ncbi:MAG: DUF86 domain-containing protein [Planctomycetes bacterium]|nr:DUF86 domain-containing protein [Planctomycetota bacterium]
MKYNGVIQRKFALLDKQLLQLNNHTKDIDFDTFKDSWILRSMTERALQVMVEIVIDVAERIIALENAGPTATSAEAIDRLVELNVLKSVQPYSDMVKFRNLIVQQYEEIDPAILYDILENKMENFRQFRNEIDKL